MEILISGASTGIGRHTAVHLARTGHSVWAGVRSEAAFNEIKKLNVKGLKPVHLDVCDEASIVSCVGHIQKEAGLLHALVNNAGIVIAGPVEAVPLSEWRAQFEVNLFGVIRLTQQCLPLLRQCKGRIVNISSIAGRVAAPLMAPYSASKFALESVSDCLRRELSPQGISVSVVEPGPIATPIWDKSLKRNLAISEEYSDELKQIYGGAIERFQENVRKAPDRSSPVADVIIAIEHALTSKRPRIRYPVGRGIKFMMMLAGTVPDRALDRVLRRI